MYKSPETLRGKILFITSSSDRGASLVVICQSKRLCTFKSTEIEAKLKKLSDEGFLSEINVDGKVHYSCTEEGNKILKEEEGRI